MKRFDMRALACIVGATGWLASLSPGSLLADENPPAPGFNAEASDDEAIVIADQVMEALGGRKAWDDTRYLTWNFFGRRRHV
ncbi:MAG: hypothetical protein P8Y44_10915, partial [Acidobacteriota bacterium]